LGALIGAQLLEGSLKVNDLRQIQRAMRGIAFAVAVTRFRGSSIAVLKGSLAKERFETRYMPVR
jgi:hypothetical protein